MLTISAELAARSASNITPFEQKACFYQVKLDGKAKWECPIIQTSEGLWDLGPEPKGQLEFSFTQDPLEYKKECGRLAKEAAGAQDPATARLKPLPKEILTE